MEKDVGADEDDEESNMEPKEIKQEKVASPPPSGQEREEEGGGGGETAEDNKVEAEPAATEEPEKSDKEVEKGVENEDEKVSSSEGVCEPSSTTPEEGTAPAKAGGEPLDPEKPHWPFSTDLNTRIRKLITAFQRYFKKEEIKNAQKAKVGELILDKMRGLVYILALD